LVAKPIASPRDLRPFAEIPAVVRDIGCPILGVDSKLYSTHPTSCIGRQSPFGEPSMGEYLERLARLGQLDPAKMEKLLFETDERAAVIMATSFLDDLLTSAIIRRFRHTLSETQAQELFTGYGPLSTLSAKAAVSYHLGVFNDEIKHDLSIIRKIRNGFSHTYETVSFSDSKISTQCNALKLQSPLVAALEARAGTSPKGRFAKSVINIAVRLVFNAMVAEAENQLLFANRKAINEEARRKMAENRKPVVETPAPSS
jgi:DNA-binding MltR family transcriptional regulator